MLAPLDAPLLKVKTAIPPAPPHLVVRRRLLERLDDAAARPFTLVSAPAGFGKTTLAASWASAGHEQRRVAWISLETSERDPVRFMRYVVAALRTIDPSFGLTLLSSLGAPGNWATTDLVTLLLSDINELKYATVLVLDNYDAVEGTEVSTGIEYLVGHMPDSLRLVVLARQNPQLPLATYRASQWMSHLGAEDLQFSYDETLVFLQHAVGRSIDAESVRALWSKTEGWIAVLQLYALSLQERLDRSGTWDGARSLTDSDVDDQYVVDYLAGEVLRQQPAEFHPVLRRIAVLDHFCSSLCDATADRNDSDSLLAHLVQANLVLRLDDHRGWFRYNHLFAAFLRSKLDADEKRDVHRKAAIWYETHGDAAQAIKHAIEGDDIGVAVRVIRHQTEDTRVRGEIRTVMRWLESLPDDVVKANADLAANKAWLLYLFGRSTEAQEYVAELTPAKIAAAPPSQRAEIAVFRTYLALNWGDPEDAVPLALDALQRLDGRTSFYRIVALNFLGQAQSLVGATRAAVQTLHRAHELGQLRGIRSQSLDALMHLTPLMLAQGHPYEAARLCQTVIDQYVDGCGRALPISGLAHVALGNLFYEANDLTAARERLEAGLALCEKLGVLYYILVARLALARLQHASGERDAAWRTLAFAREAISRSPSPRRRRLIAEATADLQLREANATAAAKTLDDLTHSGYGILERQDSLTHARLHVTCDQPDVAMQILDRLESVARRENCDGTLVRILALKAVCMYSMGSRAAAIQVLDEAVALGAPAGFRRAFLDAGPALIPILKRVRHDASGFVRSLIDSPSERERVKVNTLPEPLTHMEVALIQLVDRGLKNREIAEKLAITVGTTKQYLNRVFGKLQVRNRTEAVARARHLDLL